MKKIILMCLLCSLCLADDWFSDKKKNYTISDKTWSIGFGLFSSKATSIMPISKDFKLSQESSVYTHLSLSQCGFGYSYQKNGYNQNGLVFRAGYHRWFVVEEGTSIDKWLPQISIAYQLNNKKSSLWTFGIKCINWEDDFETGLITLIVPTIGYEFKFSGQ